MRNDVKTYYGIELSTSDDLKTDACCDEAVVPQWLKPILSNIHDEVMSKYYGCGLVTPLQLEGCRVLDLGSGAGRDVYALAQLVGPTGSVVGVDMTPEQLAVARKHQAYHADSFGYDNVEFVQGYLENLSELGLEEGSFDVVVSNCVINLCTDKAAVLSAVRSLLKPGGEFYFSDVYSEQRVPPAVAADPVIYGECLGGALYWNDFLTLAREAGFADARLVESRPLAITDQKIMDATRGLEFHSATYRLFALDGLEGACEDYGQAVTYRGSVENAPHEFVLDGHHVMQTGRVFPVCGNTFRMLNESRFAQHFDFHGDFSRHFGIFDGCGTTSPFAADTPSSNDGACC